MFYNSQFLGASLTPVKVDVVEITFLTININVEFWVKISALKVVWTAQLNVDLTAPYSVVSYNVSIER